MNPATVNLQYLYQPREVSLETLALCNARCTFCPYPTLERKGVKMSDMDLLRLHDQMIDWQEPFFISPFKVNEPLLDSRLQAFCERVVSHIPKATLRLFTNGQPLTDRHIDWIAEIPLGRLAHLWISLNDFEAQAYGELMGLSLSMTLSRIDHLHYRAVHARFPHRVSISRVSDSATPKFSERDIQFLRFVYDRWPRFEGRIIKRDGWLGYVEPSAQEIPNAPCGRWWELNVCADGKAALCCMDGTGEYSIGNIHESSLLDIYNQPHLIKRRERAVSRHGIEPCRRCTY